MRKLKAHPNLEDAIQGYVSGLGIAVLCETYGIKRHTLKNELVRRNIPWHKDSKAYDPKIVSEIIALAKSGKSHEYIADRFGTTAMTIKRYIDGEKHVQKD